MLGTGTELFTENVILALCHDSVTLFLRPECRVSSRSSPDLPRSGRLQADHILGRLFPGSLSVGPFRK